MDMQTGEVRAFSTLPVGTIIDPDTAPTGPLVSEALEDGLALLGKAERVYGHRWLQYDAMVLNKLYGTPIDTTKIRDTLILSKLLWPEIGKGDVYRVRKGILPGRLLGRQGLEAWGYRLGCAKGTFGKSTDWQTCSPEMVSYCAQDLRVNKRLADEIARKLKEGWLPERAVQLEHDAALVCEQIMVSGFRLDKKKAIDLYGLLAAEVDRLSRALQDAFPPVAQYSTFVPKRDNKKLGYVKGKPIIREKVVPLNPGSREQIAARLTERYGWQPAVNPRTGKPVVDDDTLATLSYPEVPLIRKYLETSKLLGMVATGKNAWLKVERDGVIHGSIDTCGAITARCTHSSPNVAQVPKVLASKEHGVLMGAEGGYGWECRSLFCSVPGWIMVGADQSALELRCLGHYMAIFDDGDYIHVVLDGDVHTVNMKAAGLTSRDQAKTFIYGFLYGAGDAKIGEIVCPPGTPEAERKRAGAALKKAFLAGLPALAKLRKKCREAADEGRIEAIDGRFLPIRKAHAALNTLLQSAGAIACKTWLVLYAKRMREAGLIWNCWHPVQGDFAFCGFIHDEIQGCCKPEHVETMKRIAVETATEAGSVLNFACRLDGEAKTGKTWAETH